MKKGLFITFEGVDGCGKSTQARFLAEYLEERGFEVTLTREPGGCPISEQIREIILSVDNAGMSAQAEALLYAASRTQLVEEVILPALSSGKIVICDRFFDSSIAYQGFGRELGMERVAAFNAFAVEHCMPDITLFMEFPPGDARRRMSRRQTEDRLEREPIEFFERVYAGFMALKDSYPQRFSVIDVSGSKFETRDKIRLLIDELVKKWNG